MISMFKTFELCKITKKVLLNLQSHYQFSDLCVLQKNPLVKSHKYTLKKDDSLI